jgi:molecular chaperone Hsp33
MADAALADDLIQPFRVESLDIHGRLVRLGPTIEAILGRHRYPEPVSVLLGEALALTAALAGALKFDGTFTTQIQGDGPLRLLIADYQTGGAMRGYAGFDAAAVEARGGRAGGAGNARLFGAGRMAFTVDQGPDSDRYQGMVALEGATLSSNARAYLTRSAEIHADIQVAAHRWPDGEGGAAWRAGCLLVEQLPYATDSDDERAEQWRRARTLARGLVRADLADPLALPPALIGPLFPGHDIRIYRPRPLRCECRCSPARATAVVESIPRAERADLAIDGRIEVTCDYCSTRYLFELDGTLLGDA